VKIVNNADIRGLILQDIYARKRSGEETVGNAAHFSKLLGIDESLANFNLQYLVESGLLQGEVIASIGTTKKIVLVWDLTPFGIEAVEGRAGQRLAINYNIINVNAPVNQSNFAAGAGISQAVSISMSSFEELLNYIDEKLDKSQSAILKPLVEELEAEVKADYVKPSLLRKIGETVKMYGPIALPIIDAITKLTGSKL